MRPLPRRKEIIHQGPRSVINTNSDQAKGTLRPKSTTTQSVTPSPSNRDTSSKQQRLPQSNAHNSDHSRPFPQAHTRRSRTRKQAQEEPSLISSYHPNQ